MLSNIAFFIYIFAAFIGFAAAALVWLIIKYKNRKAANPTSVSMTWFIVSSLLVGILYFINMYAGMVLDYFETPVVLRMLDVGGFLCMTMFWSLYIRKMAGENGQQFRITEKLLVIAFAALIIWSTASYAAFTDGLYYVEGYDQKIYMTVVQIVLIVLASGCIITYAAAAIKNADSIKTGVFISINSVLIIINSIWNAAATIGLFRGSIAIEKWQEQVTDPTPLMIMAINAVTLIFIIRHDFKPLYFSPDCDDEEIIGSMAEKAKMTEREKEVAALVYRGFSNEEIADALFISKNTVKHHIYNFYRKLGISTRMDLINMVKKQK